MFKDLIGKATGFVKENSNEILIGSGIVGMGTSAVMAVSATPKALRLMEDKKEELGVTYLTKREVVETTWKEYAPSVILGVASAAAIIAGASNSRRNQTALATVYAVSETTLKEYKRKTKEIVGEEKAREIDGEVNRAVAKRRQTPVIVDSTDTEYIIHTGLGDTLIYDTFSGRYFRATRNSVEAAVNKVNKHLYNEYLMTVNDFYNEMNIPPIGAGNLIGWKSDKESMEISFDSDVDRNGNPYLVLTYTNRPSVIYTANGSW